MKAILLSFAVLFSICFTNAQQFKGPIAAGGFSNETLTGSSSSWVAVENTNISDDQYADFGNLSTSSGSFTDYLHVNKFQIDVPLDAIITGIEVNVERSDPSQNTADYSVRILKYDIVTGDEKSTGDAYTATDSYKTFGNSGDLWGEAWTPEMINDNGFGVAIAAQRIDGTSGLTEGKIDNINIIVYYTQPSTLPVSLLNFAAKKNSRSIDLSWITEGESNMSNYDLQRSTDGRNFSSIKTLQSNNSLNKINYAYTDNKPVNGIAYYRLKLNEIDGSYSYSKIITVQLSTGNTVTVYPTLWKKGTLLNISNPNNEKLTAHFFTVSGQKVGAVVTNTSTLSTVVLNKQSGIIYFSITNAEGLPVSKGSIIVN